MRNSRSNLLMATLMALSLAACTRPKGETADVSFALPASQKSNLKSYSKKGEVALDEMLIHATVKISADGKIIDGGELNWNVCRADDSSCDHSNNAPNFTFSVPTGKSVTFQLLAVYQVDQTMSFYYKDVTETLTGDKNLVMVLDKLTQNVVGGRASGRYFTAPDQGPTGIVDISYDPPGKLPMKIESSVMLNGWFDLFMLYGLPLKYVVHEKTGDRLLWGKAMSNDMPEMDPFDSGIPGKQYTMVRAFYPVGVRIESGNSQPPKQEDARVHTWGHWADPSFAGGSGYVGSKFVCKDGLPEAQATTRLRRYATGSAMASAPAQQLHLMTSSSDPVPSVAQLTNPATTLAIQIQGGHMVSGGYCGGFDVVNDNYAKFQLVKLAQVDSSEDEQAGFRDFMRAMPSGTGLKFFDVTGTTTKTIAGKVLPGLENLFTSIRFYKNTSNANGHMNAVDCQKIVNGPDRLGFVEGSLTSTTIAADGSLSITSNITSAEASAGVTGAICGMNGSTPFPMGIFLDSWNFSQGSGSGTFPIATELLIAGPQGSSVSADVANNVCTPFHVYGINNGQPAQIPSGLLAMDSMPFAALNSYASCAVAGPVGSYGSSEMVVYLKRSTTGAGSETMHLTAFNGAQGTLSLNFSDVAATAPFQIHAAFPGTISRYDCVPIFFESWHDNGPGDQYVINFPHMNTISLTGNSGWAFYMDGTCQNSAGATVNLGSSAPTSSILFARYTGSGTTGVTFTLPVAGSCAAYSDCAPNITQYVTVTSPGPVAKASGYMNSVTTTEDCDQVELQISDSANMPAVGTAGGVNVAIQSSSPTDEFFSDNACTSPLSSSGGVYTTPFYAADTYKRVYHRGHAAGTFSLSIGYNGSGSTMNYTQNLADFDDVILTLPGESYDPSGAGTLSGGLTSEQVNYPFQDYNVYLRRMGQALNYNGTLSVTIIRTGADALNTTVPMTFVNGQGFARLNSGPETGTSFISITVPHISGVGDQSTSPKELTVLP